MLFEPWIEINSKKMFPEYYSNTMYHSKKVSYYKSQFIEKKNNENSGPSPYGSI